ncbi:hypothetical protein [Arthrobacter sp. EPSL27]|uniref:hypothetical protein n=1 Tax=Arthrobacter sp. EPSL27 TaxID=1745378 RepID=UPI00074A2BF7|nr:hypothetical protein [Arthrobacter sp. EPSL27]KUM36816.1 hypothetical protein AR539_05420 [Arthrobacter sp. EPSL27]
MRTAARTPFHALRSAMVAFTVLSLAAGAHTLAGGHLPSPGILLALLALTGLATTAATRLKLNFAALAGMLGAGQFVLHGAFSAFSAAPLNGSALNASAPGASAFPGPASGTAHHLGAVPLPPGTGGTLDAHALDTTLALDSSLSLLMLAGHALATLLCALLLARGEAALWSLAAWLRPLLQLPAPVVLHAPAVPAAAFWPAESVPLPWRNLRRDCRRGPPPAVVLP